MIVDDWLEYIFEDSNVAGQQLVIANQFRSLWKRLVNLRLKLAAKV